MRVIGTLWIISVMLSGTASAEPGVFELDLSEAEAGAEPEGLFVVDGVFVAAETERGKALELAAEPLAEGVVLLGDSLRGGGTIRALVDAKKRGRSYPRFGVGLHGISGYRLRVVPAQRVVEVVADDESISQKPYDWSDAEPTWVEMSILSAGEGAWKLEGRAWSAGGERPGEPLVSLRIEKDRLSGKGVLSGTPYAGLPIRFFEVRIEAEAGAITPVNAKD